MAPLRQLLATFSETEQVHLAQELSGAYQTETRKQHRAEDANGMCTHCSQPDSKYHRIYECPVSQKIKMQFQASVIFFQEKGWDVHELPFILQHENYELLRQLHYCQAEASVAVGTKQHLAALADTGVPVPFYTDGALMEPLPIQPPSPAVMGRMPCVGHMYHRPATHCTGADLVENQTATTNAMQASHGPYPWTSNDPSI